jgi:hypothetical protein
VNADHKTVCIGSGRAPFVSVMQPADLAQLHYLPELRWL